ncbi:unnamed protein product, partial [Rotaria sp. Silwood1]
MFVGVRGCSLVLQIPPISIERSDDNIVPQSTHLSSTMTINESTQIGEILCSYLPYMA